MEKIRLLIVDDIANTRESIQRMLAVENDIEIVGEAGDGQQALEMIEKTKPHVVLMDINMPKMDGIQASEAISLQYPQVAIIIMSVQGEQEYLKRAMAAGAKEYIVKPFSFDDLINTVRRVHQLEQKRLQAVSLAFQQEKAAPQPCHVVTVFSTKGGVGKSTVAVNLAVALAQGEKKRVAILDLDLQFGDVAVMFNVLPQRTITELTQELNNLDAEGLEKFMVTHHRTGVNILPAPSRPEYAELITAEQIKKIIGLLKESYQYIIIDTPPFFHDTNMVALDMSDQIVLVSALDLPTIKNIRLNMEVFETLHYKGKTMLVVNRASEEIGIKVEDLEQSLGFLSACLIPSDGKLVISCINKGLPFVTANPNSKISSSINKLCKLVQKKKCTQEELKAQRRGGFLARLWGGA